MRIIKIKPGVVRSWQPIKFERPICAPADRKKARKGIVYKPPLHRKLDALAHRPIDPTPRLRKPGDDQ
jgi:hypothetical protein